MKKYRKCPALRLKTRLMDRQLSHFVSTAT